MKQLSSSEACTRRDGLRAQAKAQHELAKQYHPAHPSVIFNKQYFAKLDAENTTTKTT
ncbi:hypothetical protein [Paenibacillus silvisoli]|uniref:hypothetical protein n=1 Tax=Paenibacillus silvisoli TaxID=3110539 RepID=UPI002805963B|nr:hypothetical protein [Paenibacillus silvisoli]